MADEIRTTDEPVLLRVPDSVSRLSVTEEPVIVKVSNDSPRLVVTEEPVILRPESGSDTREATLWGMIAGNLNDQSDLVDALAGKVSKTGDTMTGPLTLNDTALRILYPQLDATTPPDSNFISSPVHIRDVNSQIILALRSFYTTGRSKGWRLTARNSAGTLQTMFGAYLDANNVTHYEIDNPDDLRQKIRAADIFRMDITMTGNGVDVTTTTFTNARITENTNVIGFVIQQMQSALAPGIWTTAAGSITISGIYSGTVSITLYLSDISN